MNGINANNSISTVYPDLVQNRRDGIAHLTDLGDDLYRVGLTNIFNLSNVTKMELNCVEPKLKKAVKVVFAVPTDWDTHTDVGIKVQLVRNPEWDNATFGSFDSMNWFGYDIVANGSGTATEIRDGVYDMITNWQINGKTPELFDIVKVSTNAIIIAGNSNEWDFNVYNWNASNTITVEQKWDAGSWDGDDWKRFRPIPSLYPGQDLPDYLMRCKSPCLISLHNCVQACSTEEQEMLLMAGKSLQGTVHIYADGDDEDFVAFVALIEAAIPNAATTKRYGCPCDTVFTAESDHYLIKSKGYSNSSINVVGLATAYTINEGSTQATDTNLLASTYYDFKIKKTIYDALADGTTITITYSNYEGEDCDDIVIKIVKGIGLLK